MVETMKRELLHSIGNGAILTEGNYGREVWKILNHENGTSEDIPTCVVYDMVRENLLRERLVNGRYCYTLRLER